MTKLWVLCILSWFSISSFAESITATDVWITNDCSYYVSRDAHHQMIYQIDEDGTRTEYNIWFADASCTEVTRIDVPTNHLVKSHVFQTLENTLSGESFSVYDNDYVMESWVGYTPKVGQTWSAGGRLFSSQGKVGNFAEFKDQLKNDFVSTGPQQGDWWTAEEPLRVRLAVNESTLYSNLYTYLLDEDGRYAKINWQVRFRKIAQ